MIEIKDAEPGIVGRALTYLYTMGYPDVLDSERHQVPASNPNANSGGQVSTTTPTPAANEESKKALDLLLMHARVYSMADRLDISGLRLLSSRKFKKIFEKGPQADFSTAVVVSELCRIHHVSLARSEEGSTDPFVYLGSTPLHST